MDFFEFVSTRRSIRTFTDRRVDDEQLHKILEAANLAPSAGNLQAYEIYVVREPSLRTSLAEAAHSQSFVSEAPLVLVFCAHPARSAQRYKQRGERLYAIQDATIACTFAMLAATDLGLGTVWVGAFDEESMRQAIGAPPGVNPVALLPIGYAAEKPEAAARRPLHELVHIR